MILSVDEVFPCVRLVARAVQAQLGAVTPQVLSSAIHPASNFEELVAREKSLVVAPVFKYILKQKSYLIYYYIYTLMFLVLLRYILGYFNY